MADTTAQAIIQTAISAGVPTLSVLAGIVINNSRLSDPRAHMEARFAAMDARFAAIDTRFEDLKAMWRAELHRVEEVMDARLKHLEERD